MPRKNPTKDIDCLGGLDVDPLKIIGEYLISKDANKNFLKPPNFDSCGDDIEAFYIQEKFEHGLLTKDLQLLEEQRKIQLALSAQRIRRLVKDQQYLRARFISVNVFIRDFTEKRKIAQRKIELEIKEQRELTELIDERTKKLQDLQVFRKDLLATVKEYESYETVLNDAAAKAKCPSIEALMNRCDAIMVAQEGIMQLNAEKIQEIENMRKRIVDITKQVKLIYAGLMNELADLNRSYRKAQSDCLRWERILSNINAAIVHQHERRELARDGINQLYRLLCHRKGDEMVLTRIDVEKSLDFIKHEVELLQAVLAEYYNPTNDI